MGQTYTDLVKLEVPPEAVKGSEVGEVVVVGDVMGPTLKGGILMTSFLMTHIVIFVISVTFSFGSATY